MEARTLEEIQNQLIIALAQTNSPATDISPGSVLGALVRSLSVLHLEQDNRMKELYKKSSFISAEGSELDNLASSFGKKRKLGAYADGFVILNIETGSATIQPGTTLTDLNTGNQFAINTNNSITLTSFKEEVFPVISLDVGAGNNLKAGTKLSVTFSELIGAPISATVGYKRAVDGSYCGDLTNGLDFETDSDFRSRLLNSFNSDNLSTTESLRQRVLDLDFVTNVWIKTIIPGTVEILVSSPIEITEERRLALLEYVKPFISTGVLPVVTVNRLNYLDFTIQVSPYKNTDINILTSQIRSYIDFYLNSLEDAAAFSITDLNARLSPLAIFINAQLDNNIEELSNSNYQLRGLKVTYVN